MEAKTVTYINLGDIKQFPEEGWDAIETSTTFTFESVKEKEGLYLVSKTKLVDFLEREGEEEAADAIRDLHTDYFNLG